MIRSIGFQFYFKNAISCCIYVLVKGVMKLQKSKNLKVKQQHWLHFILELDYMSRSGITRVKFDTFPNNSKVPLASFDNR